MANTDNATERTLQYYTVPQRIQAAALDMLQEKVLDGKEMPDGNNPTTFLLEFAATMASGITNEMSDMFNNLYPSRAMTSTALYRHMADYDYVNLFSTPANTTIEVALSRDYLIQNAVNYTNDQGADSGYNRIVIPAFSTFTIGEYPFGIHYPVIIQVKIKKINGVIDYENCLITASLDLSTENPLLVLESDILETRTYTREGVSLFCISIPIYQFAVMVKQEDTVSNTGFSKRYTYDDKFYAARIFHFMEGAWVEMAQTLSDIVYDPEVPTAKLTVITEINTLQIDIPQVYFTTNLLGTKIRAIIYTTKGALDLDISEYAAEQYEASFLVNDTLDEDDTYSSMLKRIPYCQVLPTSDRISGGADGLTFEQLRDRVLHDSTYTLLCTTQDVANYFSDQGFTATRYLDNITNRIYLTQKELTDSEGTIISAGDINVTLTSSMLHHEADETTGVVEVTNYRTIKYVDDQNYVILPTTVFRYDQDTDSAIPMDNDWLDEYENMTTASKVELLNSDTYTYIPFHLKLSTNNSIPVAGYYDLLTPTIKNTTFAAENSNVTPRLSIASSAITHLDEGTGGYRLVISLYRSNDLSGVDVLAEDGISANIKLVLTTSGYNAQSIYIYGKYAGKGEDGNDTFVFDLNTDYKIDANDNINITNFKLLFSGIDTTSYVALSNTYKLLFFIDASFVDSTSPMTGVDQVGFPPDLSGNDVWLVTQSMTINLGSTISELFSNVSINLEAQNYLTYPTTVYETYESPQYARDENGMLIYPLEIVHDAGEVLLSTSGSGVELPPACQLVFTTYDSNKLPIYTNYLQYLQTPYTATSDPSNVWQAPSEEYADYAFYDADNHYAIETIDLLEYALTELSTMSNAIVANYGELRLQFRDATQVMDDGTEVALRELYDPLEGCLFAYVSDSEALPADSSDPENTFSLGEAAATGALYRRNPTYSNYDYTAINYTNSSGVTASLTGAVLEEIYTRLDEGATADELADEYQIVATTIQRLYTVVRTPWIRTLNAASVDQISEYWNNRQLAGTAVATVKTIQQSLHQVTSYDTYAEFKAANIAIGTTAYVSDISDQTSSMPDRLFGDLSTTALQVKGALIQNTEDGYVWLITGPDKTSCTSAILSYNCYSGLAYLVKAAEEPVFINLLSYDEAGALALNYEDCNWALIDKWPWEITETWFSLTTLGYDSDVCVQIVTDSSQTSAQVKQLGGTAQVDEAGNLTGLITDSNGDPIYDDDEDDYTETRNIIYNVRTLQVDYKLTLSSEQAHATYRTDIVELLRSYFDTIDQAEALMFEETHLYFSPIRTMGYGEFKSTSGQVEIHPLDITMSFRLYVDAYTINSEANRETIENTVLSVVDQHIAQGSISTTRLAEEIRTELSDTISYVENLGIDDNSELRVMILSDSSADASTPHLKQTLVLEDDGSVSVTRGVYLDYVAL